MQGHQNRLSLSLNSRADPNGMGMGAGRLGGLEILVLEGLAFLGIYLAVILKGGYLDAFDRDMVRKAFIYLKSGTAPSGERGS